MSEKEVIVLSLGGSLIIPEEQDLVFLHKFKKLIRAHYKKYKFVIVCGGGAIARRYISIIKKETNNERAISEAGIRATRENAMFMMQFFGKEANSVLPMDMHEVQNNLHKNNVVFCGALRYAPRTTSDSTAAKLANYLNTRFANLTNVVGLYTADPKKNKNAKLIKKISWKEFESIALKIKYKAGEHFVLDQKAAVLIRKHKINTAILGKSLPNLESFLNGKPFIGTIINS